MGGLKKNINSSEYDMAFNLLLESLKKLNIVVKSDRGNFRGGLYRHNEEWIFYLNRKATSEEKVELILSEINSKTIPDGFADELNNSITHLRKNLSKNYKEKTMSFEGRGAQRVESENLLSFRLLDKEDQIIKEGVVKTMDISRTGIAIEATTSMESGQKIELTIGFGDDVVNATGSVQNVKKTLDSKYHVGIQFDFLSEDDMSKIGMAYPSVLK